MQNIQQSALENQKLPNWTEMDDISKLLLCYLTKNSFVLNLRAKVMLVNSTEPILAIKKKSL